MPSSNTTILFPYEPDEFWEKVRELLRNELQRAEREKSSIKYDVPGLTQKPLYKAHEVCKMLTISRQTLHSWVKEGLLKQYKIKSRVFFLWSDIEKLMK